MHISLDEVILWHGINATLVYTWLVMLLLGGWAWWLSRHIVVQLPIPWWQHVLEVLVRGIGDQIADIWGQPAPRFIGFVGTLFLFISLSSLLSLVPGMHAPTNSLSTTAALACCVLVAVPFYGILERGWRGYLRHYVEPSFILLPIHVLGELTRTIALSVRLFGNMMSGAMVGAVMLAVAPFFFPLLMQALELLIGQIQAYIFAVLAMVYIAAAGQVHERGSGGQSHG